MAPMDYSPNGKDTILWRTLFGSGNGQVKDKNGQVKR